MTDYIKHAGGLIVPASYADFADTGARPEMLEVASTRDGRDITRGYVSPFELLQPQDDVLRARGNGNYQIYREVLRDWQVKSTLAQRQLAVVSKPWEVEPGGKTAKDKAAAEFLKEQLDNIRWDNVTGQMLYGVFYGYAVAEILWGQDGRYVTIDKIKARDRRRFGFDGEMGLRLLTMSKMNPGEPVSDRKFWYYATGADHDDEPYGLGLAHWLYWPVFFKRNDIKFWLIFLEKFGQPTAVGKYPGNATADEKTRLLNALSAVATESGIIVPEGMLVELLEAARSGTADYTALCDRMDQAIAKVVLGQTLTSEAVGGQYKADVQMDVRQDLVKSDADLICESFNNGPARWLTEWNFPGAKIPRVWRVVDEGEDLEKKSRVDKALHDMGYEPEDIDQINDTYGGRWVKKAAPLVVDNRAPASGSVAPNTDGTQFAEAPPALQAAIDDQTAIDTAAAEFGAQFEAMLGGQVDAIIAFAEQTGDLATLRERLAELLKAAPPAALTQALERGAFNARLLGRTSNGDSR
jgi:phage gp29-like protein